MRFFNQKVLIRFWSKLIERNFRRAEFLLFILVSFEEVTIRMKEIESTLACHKQRGNSVWCEPNNNCFETEVRPNITRNYQAKSKLGLIQLN